MRKIKAAREEAAREKAARVEAARIEAARIDSTEGEAAEGEAAGEEAAHCRTNCCQTCVLSNEPDFLEQTEWLTEVATAAGFKNKFFPKYHCEFFH